MKMNPRAAAAAPDDAFNDTRSSQTMFSLETITEKLLFTISSSRVLFPP